MPTNAYTLRPERDSDRPLLESLYASTRAEELRAVPWTAEQKAVFLRQQFDAQHAHYREHYPDAAYWIVEVLGRAVGRLYVARWSREIRLMDVAIVTEERRRGLGTALIAPLIEESRASGKPLTIHVERENPALRLYERLGFRLKEDKGVYLLLEWRADPKEATS